MRPQRETERMAYFLSPWREEGHASFGVNKITNRYIDFGENMKGGDVIDYVQRIEGCNMPTAIDRLLSDAEISTFSPPEGVSTKKSAISLISRRNHIQNDTLIDYLEEERKIDYDVANYYCEEITFQFESRQWVEYFGIAMENDVGGFAVRSTWFNGAIPPAGAKTILAERDDELYLFEGQMDFLSYVMLYGKPPSTAIILNSLVFIPMLCDKWGGYGVIHIYLDNDHAADRMVKDNLSVYPLKDHREEYKGYNDLNEYLQGCH